MFIVSSTSSCVGIMFSPLNTFLRYSVADFVSSEFRSDSKVACFHMTFKHSANAMSTV